MAKLTRRSMETTVEKEIVTASIVSTDFLKKMYPLYQREYMMNSYAGKVTQWCIDHYKKYQTAPQQDIESIFKINSDQLEDSEEKIIRDLLYKVHEEYLGEQTINEEYIFDNTRKYFSKRELRIRAENTLKLLDRDEISEAEQEFSRYKKVAPIMSRVINPFDKKEIIKVFEEREIALFRYPGAFGELIGDIERGWFIAILGAFKRGKTNFLIETALVALMQRLKVVIFSLEMSDKNLKERIYKSIGGMSDEDSLVFPVFDCEHNQRGTCSRACRTNRHTLIVNDAIPTYSPGMQYRACSVCKEEKDPDYKMAIWYKDKKPLKFTQINTTKKVNAFKSQYGKNLKMFCYPRFSAGVKDFEHDLWYLEEYEGFIPDIIIVDYADILKPDRQSKRVEDVDEIWKRLGQVASEKKAALFTASQGTRSAIYKKNTDQTDLAEWIGKLGHVDVFATLNQTPEEKEMRMLRVGLLAHRHKEFNENINAVILQQMSAGQFYLGSHILRV